MATQPNIAQMQQALAQNASPKPVTLPDIHKQVMDTAQQMVVANPKMNIQAALERAGRYHEQKHKWEHEVKPGLIKSFGALEPAESDENAVAKMRNTPEVVQARIKRAHEFLDQPTPAWQPPPAEKQAFDRTRIKEAIAGFPDVEQSKFPRDVPARSSLSHVHEVYNNPQNRELIKKQILRGLPLGGETFYGSLYPVKLAAMEAGIPPEKFDSWIHSIAPASARNSILNEMAVGQAIRDAHAHGSDLSPASLAKVREEFKQKHGIGLPMMPVHEEGVADVLKNNINLREHSKANIPTNYKIPTYGTQKAGDFAHSWVGDVHEAMGETLGSQHHPYFTTAGGFKNPEYGAAEEHMLDIAKELGIPGGMAQAGRWFGGGELTGLKSPRGDALDLLEKQVAYTLHHSGINPTPKEVRNYVLQMISTGKGHLLPWFKKEGVPDMRVVKADGGEVSQDEMLAHVMLHKADGGAVDLTNVGVEEAPDMPVKDYINPGPQRSDQMPVGGVDMIPVQPGQQLMPSPSPGGMPQPAGQPPGMQIPQDGPQNPLAQLGSPKGTPPMGMPPMGMPSPPQGGLPQGVQPQGPQPTSMSSLLNLTRQGQALNAMKPQMGMPR